MDPEENEIETIDEQFAQLDIDVETRRLYADIAQEFAQSDWEALRLCD